jgi:uncharacterized membrane protein YhaH (DUF805 family)
VNWYLEVLRKYAVFDGRARRTEYWMFTLINTLVSLAIGFAGGKLGWSQHTITTVAVIYMLFVLLPSLGVVVRRLHDTGRSGWWFLIVVVPLIGAVVLLVFALQDSEQGSNDYGANPKTSFA